MDLAGHRTAKDGTQSDPVRVLQHQVKIGCRAMLEMALLKSQ